MSFTFKYKERDSIDLFERINKLKNNIKIKEDSKEILISKFELKKRKLNSDFSKLDKNKK
jgi:hypothetical protein